MTWKFDGRPKKTIGHFLYTMSSFVHHFKAIGKFKLELQSRNAQFGSKLVIFLSPVTSKFDIWPWKKYGTSSQLLKALCFISKPSINSKWSYSPETPTLGQNRLFSCAMRPWNLTDDLEKYSLLWNQNEATVRKHQIWVKIGDFLSRDTLQFVRWPWKTIGHIVYATSSLVHHFKAICDFKMELQSGNAHLGQNWGFFVPCDLEIWRMTLKINRAPLLCYFKRCASFHSHLGIQNGATVRKRQIWVKISVFLSCVTLKFDGWHWKTIERLFYATSSFVHHSIAIREFNLELQSGNG